MKSDGAYKVMKHKSQLILQKVGSYHPGSEFTYAHAHFFVSKNEHSNQGPGVGKISFENYKLLLTLSKAVLHANCVGHAKSSFS